MTDDAFARALPTYLERWPAALEALSVEHVGIRLSPGEARALGDRNPRFRAPEGAPDAEPLDRVEAELAAAIPRFPEGAFVRLGSRSAKDSERARARGLWVGSAAAAIDMLASGSRRAAFDLRLALANRYEPYVFVRRWTEIAPWSELRCFVRGRELVGVSQYHEGEAFAELSRDRDAIRASVGRLFEEVRGALHLDDVVLDAFVERRRGDYVARLLELNPFWPKTDACLFSWEDEFDGSFRVVEPVAGVPLT